MNNNFLVAILMSSIFLSCSVDPTERNGLSLEKRKKVFLELKKAETKASKEALTAYPKPGTEGGGGLEFREQLKHLQVSYWQEVLDSNHVAINLGDSIFTEGVKEKWALKAKKLGKDKRKKKHRNQ